MKDYSNYRPKHSGSKRVKKPRAIDQTKWCTYDPKLTFEQNAMLHDKYRKFVQDRNQARFRNEEWNLEFEDYLELWAKNWDTRGKKTTDHCLARIDYDAPWQLDNVHVITRKEYVRHKNDVCWAKWRKERQLSEEYLEEMRGLMDNAN